MMAMHAVHMMSGRNANLPKTDAGERIYAVGDVHGRYDLLQKLIDEIGIHNRDSTLR